MRTVKGLGPVISDATARDRSGVPGFRHPNSPASIRLEVIDRTVEASIIVLAIVTATLAPIIFRWLAPPLPVAEEADEEA